MSFYGKEDLEAFVAAVDGSSVKWTQLHVLGTAHEPTTPTPKVRSPDDFELSSTLESLFLDDTEPRFSDLLWWCWGRRRTEVFESQELLFRL